MTVDKHLAEYRSCIFIFSVTKNEFRNLFGQYYFYGFKSNLPSVTYVSFLSFIVLLQVYEEHQKGLRDRARNEFLELLLENSDLFCKFDSHTSMSSEDFDIINDRLAGDPRYKALNRYSTLQQIYVHIHRLIGVIQKILICSQ